VTLQLTLAVWFSLLSQTERDFYLVNALPVACQSTRLVGCVYTVIGVILDMSRLPAFFCWRQQSLTRRKTAEAAEF